MAEEILLEIIGDGDLISTGDGGDVTLGFDSLERETGDGVACVGSLVFLVEPAETLTGSGAGADDVLVGTSAETGLNEDEKTLSVSRLTRFGGAIFPEKNSAAAIAGSEDNAGG